MRPYTIVIEPPVIPAGYWSCYVPDIPGCVGIGHTKDECRASVAATFAMYAEDYRECGVPLPAPAFVAETMNMAA